MMNIQNIQIAQNLFRTAEERLNARKDSISLPEVHVPDFAVDDVKISGGEDLMKVVYPPFFPIGNTQDILSIEGVKQLTGENAESKSSLTLEEQKAIRRQENNKAASPDTHAVQDMQPQVEHEVNPGVVLDLKV